MTITLRFVCQRASQTDRSPTTRRSGSPRGGDFPDAEYGPSDDFKSVKLPWSEWRTIRPEGVLSEVYTPVATREELAAAVGQVLDIFSDDEEEDE